MIVMDDEVGRRVGRGAGSSQRRCHQRPRQQPAQPVATRRQQVHHRQTTRSGGQARGVGKWLGGMPAQSASSTRLP